MVQFSCPSVFTEVNVASWKKKKMYLVIANLPKLSHSERKDHLFSFSPPPSPDIHSLWSLFKVAFTISSSCNGGFYRVPLREMCAVEIL